MASGSVQENGDDGVVLAMIQITDDQVPNGQHLRVQHTYGADGISSFLIQQREGEVEEEGSISSTTAWWWWRGSTPAGLRQALNGGGEMLGRGGAAPWMLCAALPLPLYLSRKGEGGRPPLDEI